MDPTGGEPWSLENPAFIQTACAKPAISEKGFSTTPNLELLLQTRVEVTGNPVPGF